MSAYLQVLQGIVIIAILIFLLDEVTKDLQDEVEVRGVLEGVTKVLLDEVEVREVLEGVNKVLLDEVEVKEVFKSVESGGLSLYLKAFNVS